MIVFPVLLALHLLAAMAWVGGMAFALLVLRPSLAVLDPPARLAVHTGVFRRFFLLIWHTVVLILLTGYAMLFGFFGGFSQANWAVQLMHLLGLVMIAVFLVAFFGPWRAMRADAAAAPASAERIRSLVQINLVLGVLTIIVAAFAA